MCHRAKFPVVATSIPGSMFRVHLLSISSRARLNLSQERKALKFLSKEIPSLQVQCAKHSLLAEWDPLNKSGCQDKPASGLFIASNRTTLVNLQHASNQAEKYSMGKVQESEFLNAFGCIDVHCFLRVVLECVADADVA